MYEALDFSHLLGTPGFSDNLLNTHFGLYQGYVKNTNSLSDRLKELAENAGPGEYAELKRRFGWEFNGMRLHELYFENMTKDAVELDENSNLGKKLTTEFGSIDQWRKDFVSTGALRGIGWAILAYDKRGDRLFNTWINEHDVGHLSGAKPLLVMDVFEHAFILDYGMKRADYIEAFMKAVNWAKVAERM
ncbi:MAG: superoxide dismutase [Candidatus Magasanikbacteria bacterium RIFCSPHIGHO2_01_FULL_33_34]|uniref:superoxide dismutase n=1 Tax=Candidatus Magasanikbacteria bacterium RIFCSPHIGHO2_01_FULL_33_34 TaxID=1798671 RepID=A0A1F6LL18_9BACT|nr:MAG: superoxide dismutase [Candidatus Magasanikbacteria bacterium RIFCSPHIGHO2_01_FULL_33_34]OGH65806.1 MAG: superoxide dismutase [Candidatus Magasanikbacteria bacterium RIFCSPHIGHO2_02_FULL_33_17]OGH75171.1 MAG: superoxide dismutase [Candidatus Magasanikbacteria bacterium RIFCSPLOWO2_01_FULL_33_34]OGH81292.1 MAG: superoxide dismutase [Candidatus Magasanikbacteria bacterium RIFCSPLOWO2_12_FULL_34_7]